MKKTLLSALTILIGQSVFAQSTPVSQTAQNKNALLEELTGINCQYCPDGHKRAHDIDVAHPGRVVLVNVHAGGYAATTPDLRTPDGNLINTFFAPAGYPAGSVQRTLYSTEAVLGTSRANWAGQVTAALAQASPVNIAMDAEIDVTTRVLTLHVEMFYTTPSAAGVNNYLNIGILQNNYEGPQVSGAIWNPTQVLPDGNYNHQHVFRGYINQSGTWGETVDASQTGVITRTITYTLPSAVNGIPLDIANLDFFSFLHKGHHLATDSQVITAAKITPTLVNIPPAKASVTAITNDLNVCPNGSVKPVVRVANGGAEITALKFSTVINGGAPVIYDWTGSIPQLASQDITLDAIAFTAEASNSVTVTVTEVNGGAGSLGGVVTKSKAITIGNVGAVNNVTVKVATDAYGGETTWKIFNSAGTVVGSGGPYANQSAAGTFPQDDVSLTLPNDCYSVVVYDAEGDGFNYSYGEGSFQVVSGGYNIATINTFGSGFSKSGAMQINSLVAGINESAAATGMNVFPNPATDNITVAFNADHADYTISLVDLQGRVLSKADYSALTGEQAIKMSVAGIATGNYIVKVASNAGTSIQNVVIK